MQTESLAQTKLEIIRLECPNFSASDLKILETEYASGKPHKKRSFWKIDQAGERAFQTIKNFTPHQIYFYHLFKLAERNDEIDRDKRLGVPSAKLASEDYDYWCRADYWTSSEFIGLLLGLSPNYIAPYTRETGSATTEIDEKVLSLKMLLDRSYDLRKLDYRSSPQTLLAWAKSKQIDLPERLIVAAEKFRLFDYDDEDRSIGKEMQDQNVIQLPNTEQATRIEPPVNKKERDSMLKLIIGMAVRAYVYDPTQSRSSIASEISDDLATCGISMDVDTIRKYLKQSAEYLPREAKPNSTKPKPNSRTA